MTMATAGMPRLWVDDSGTGSSPSLFAAALLVASIFHLILILGLGFELPKSSPEKLATRPLEVLVLRHPSPSDEKPEIADAFAQVDRTGSGVEEAQDTNVGRGIDPVPQVMEPEPEPAESQPRPPPPTEPLPANLPRQPAPLAERTPTATIEPAPDEPEPVQPPEPEILAQPEPEPVREPAPELQPPAAPVPPQVTAAQILASRNQEIAELTARIQHSSVAYANRPRRKAISASTREYKFANYLEAWRRKVERIGNLNYPDEAKRHKMYGNLILHVAVRADGRIERIRVLRSSGFDVLDEAAIKIVELAAPFAPFPPDIKAETDILDITRTWQFLSSNRLGWDN
jgi:protein TonB